MHQGPPQIPFLQRRHLFTQRLLNIVTYPCSLKYILIGWVEELSPKILLLYIRSRQVQISPLDPTFYQSKIIPESLRFCDTSITPKSNNQDKHLHPILIVKQCGPRIGSIAGPGVYHCGPLHLSHDEQEAFVAHSFILE